jgi:hypothetical protein
MRLKKIRGFPESNIELPTWSGVLIGDDTAGDDIKM